MTPILELLDAIRDHLATFELPDPSAVHLAAYGPEIGVQTGTLDTPELGAVLLAWADTLADPKAEAWRTQPGDRIQLSVTGRLTDGHPVRIYGGLPHRPHGIGGHLDPGETAPVPLLALRHLADLGEVSGR